MNTNRDSENLQRESGSQTNCTIPHELPLLPSGSDGVHSENICSRLTTTRNISRVDLLVKRENSKQISLYGGE